MKSGFQTGGILFSLAIISAAAAPRYRMQAEAGYLPGASTIALQQYLTTPIAVAYDARGALYYATPDQVWRWNSDGTAKLIAGNGSPAAAAIEGGRATAASFGGIVALSVDSQGNLYIADRPGSVIRKVTPDGTISTFAGTGRISPGGSGAKNGTPARQVEIAPAGLAIDSASLYASDAANYAIVAFSLDGQNSRIVAGNHGEGSDGDGGPAASGRIGQPAAVAVAVNRLFFSDATNLEIRQVDLETGILSAVTGQPGASMDIALGLGTGLAARPDGSLLAQGSHRIWHIDPQTGSAMPFAGTGIDGLSGDGRPAALAALRSPAALAVHPATGDVAIADDAAHLVRVVSAASGVIQTVAGMRHFAGDGGPATAALFDGATCIASDAAGNLYVADTGNNRIRKLTRGVISTVAGTGDAGFSGDEGPAAAAQLALSTGTASTNCLAVDGAGNVFVADAGNARVRRIDSKGIISTYAGGGTAPPTDGMPANRAALRPLSIAADADGNLYIAEPGHIFRVDSAGVLATVSGDGVIDSTGDGSAATAARVGLVSCMAVSGPNLYFCEALISAVRRVDTTQNFIATLAGAASGSALTNLSGLAADTSGRLYVVADNGSGRNQVAIIDSDGSLGPLDARPAQPGSNGARTMGIAVDPSGTLHVSDGIRIYRLIPAPPLQQPPPSRKK